MALKNIFGCTHQELSEVLTEQHLERFRAEQIFYWLYNRAVHSFDEMTNLPKSLRQQLAQHFSIAYPALSREEISADGTRKFLFRLGEGFHVETVLIPAESDEDGFPKRRTLCVSTQAGCPLGCRFCATASMKLKRNLTAGEIVAQYLVVRNMIDRRITNLVYMGMGEPMLNYENVMKSVEIITDEKSCAVSSSRITISTAGLADGIRRMADDNRKVKLAISLHSGEDEIRTSLMPVNKKYPLESVLEAAEYYYRKTKRRITYEYILFDGLNDTNDALRKLVKIVRRVPSKVNIIPFHSIDFVSYPESKLELRPSPPEKVEEFARKLRDQYITVMIRSSSGKDIHAACGQLAVLSTPGTLERPPKGTLRQKVYRV